MHRVGQPSAVERMEEIEPRKGLHLVPLQMPDEVPPYRHSDGIHFWKRLLHPVLTNVAQPRVPCSSDGIGSVRLGHRDDLYHLAMTGTSHRGIDSVTHFA